MSEENIKLQVPLDDSGFLTLQCPFCGRIFKISGEVAESEDYYQLYCPHCGLVSEADDFLSEEVIKHALTLTENHVIEMMNDFVDDMGKKFKNTDFIRFEKGKKIKKKVPNNLFEENNMEFVDLDCCNRKIKIFYKNQGKPYCPYCGVK
ncbi:hypothetical protein [Orenia marismortui]|uniref:Uncharacterized protein n=1 Tax=Orenia marismortui TaxID=46469 RepID=A0A4R8GMG9_9FIRM|nr:hypothetical protein [Orenia marismortui]TDX44404.1 hypothetical protein C7959_1558 [Orenia marismortui]